MADLDDAMLQRLVHEGEGLVVERKREPPADPKFAATVCSFANTLGGWVLLGVEDDGTVCGWQPDAAGRTDLQSHLAQVLRRAADPLPPFVAQRRRVEGRTIVVMRVYESSDTPHVVRGTGAVYVRSASGQEPVDDHRTLLDLAGRGRRAGLDAWQRLQGPLAVAHEELPVFDAGPLRAPLITALGGPAATTRDPLLTATVRASPLTRGATFADWAVSRSAVDRCLEIAERLVPHAGTEPSLRPFARGVVVQNVRLNPPHVDEPARYVAVVVAHSDGVAGASLTSAAHDLLDVPALSQSYFGPLVEATADLLEHSEAIGRAALGIWLATDRDGEIAVRDLTAADSQRLPARIEFHGEAELTVPADQRERDGVVASAERALARHAGIARYEGDD